MSHDVVVVGGGNAALCAAIAAAEEGASVLVLERAPEEERGGNSSFTEGLMRFVYDGRDDIIALSPDLNEAELKADFGSYTEDKFFDDMATVTHYRTDPDLCEVLVRQSNAVMHWLHSHKIRFLPQFGRQSFTVNGQAKFWGGATLAAVGGGQGLVEALYNAAERLGVEVRYDAWVKDLIRESGRVCGVTLEHDGQMERIDASAVVLACGGFEANAEWRARYLGPGWDLVKVRGSKFNTGDGLAMALAIGAQPAGNWSGCHAVGWERYASEFGDISTVDEFERDSYPFSIMINSEGKRFLDEGADIRNYTYAKYGRIILEQPGQFAWQIFDSTVKYLLRPEYSARQVTKVVANSIDELAEKLDVDGEQLIKTIKEFNNAVKRDVEFNPAVKDGKAAEGLEISKSNWAIPLENPPYEAYSVTCGVTFTFGGLKTSTSAEVIDANHHVMPGLFVAGEMLGGLFYFNYPGATGLTSGAVFGRVAGKSAAKTASQKAAA